MQSTDERIRHEAAMLYANGETRQAIGTLISRINETNGHCSAQIWLCVLDLYQIQQQQAPYEKLAVFFSNRFHFSPPAWEQTQQKENKQTGHWRNALIVEGSPSDIHEDKIRDFVRASKEASESRIDLSRMRLDDDEVVAEQEIKRLLATMERLKRIKCPTMLMGDAELVRHLKRKIVDDEQVSPEQKMETKPQNITELNPYWLLMFELLQWRGLEEEFDDLAMRFTNRYDFCPIGYDPSLAIAMTPSSQDDTVAVTTIGLELPDVVLDAQAMGEYAQTQWDNGLPAEYSFKNIQRIGLEAAQDFTHLLQAQTHPEGITPQDTIFYDVSEIISSLFEVTGLVGFATVHHRHEKLRDLLEV